MLEDEDDTGSGCPDIVLYLPHLRDNERHDCLFNTMDRDFCNNR